MKNLCATDCGYDKIFSSLSPGEGYVFVPVGTSVEAEDEEFFMGAWSPVEANATYSFFKVAPSIIPIRRKIKIENKQNSNKWSCGHGRSKNDVMCQVCSVIYYKKVVS